LKEKLIELCDLNVAYPTQKELAFNQLNLSVYSGERILVIGENGVGKTALLKTISGLIPPKGGSVFFKAKNIEQWSSREIAKQLAFVGSGEQHNQLIRVEEFVAFGRYPFTGWLAVLKDSDRLLIQKEIQACGIENLKEKKIAEISEGERQKVLIARARVQQAEALVLDEPASHLDMKNSLSILQLLSQRHDPKNSLIFSSHQIEVAISIADKIWLCHRGAVHELEPETFLKEADYQEMVLGKQYFYDQEKRAFRLKI